MCVVNSVYKFSAYSLRYLIAVEATTIGDFGEQPTIMSQFCLQREILISTTFLLFAKKSLSASDS